MNTEDIYSRLADHLSRLGMGYPPREGLGQILMENWTPSEAEVLLALPTDLIPLKLTGIDSIIDKAELPREQVLATLERLSRRGLLFSGKAKEGQNL